MSRALLEELHRYFSAIEMPDEQEQRLQQQLAGELPYFKVTSVSRDDLKHAGFDTSTISDADMETLADKLGNDYCEQLFWDSLKVLAEEYLDIPKEATLRCPLCRKHPVAYDAESGKHYCMECETDWSDAFVLVKFPEDAGHFEQEATGYPCFNAEDNGARYVPEYDYIRHFKKSPEKEKCYHPVSWPDSQSYMDNPSCEAVTDEEGLNAFGPSSFWVPAKVIEINPYI